MTDNRNIWGLVLAAGDGIRLSALTTDPHGIAVPKQFCSLRGDDSLLQNAVERAGTFVSRERLCVIVAREHRRYWQKALTPLSSGNVIVQPRNRGTANGILLSALWILAQDRHAYIAFLPSDHHVADETVLAQALKRAAALTVRYPEELLLIGVEPEEADPELGYLVPSVGAGEARRVGQFVEKPSADNAGKLIAAGALWNTFIFIARGRLLLDLLRERVPHVVQAMSAAVLRSPASGARERALEELYQELAPLDFSRAILQGAETRLRVVRAAACGWTDLGTPRRVMEALRRAPTRHSRQPVITIPAFMNLAQQHQRTRGIA